MQRSVLRATVLVFVLLGPALAALSPAFAGPSLLVDMRSGKVLSEDQPFRRWYPASLTKLMTVYVTFRAIQAGEITLKSPVTMSANAAKEPPSKMGYKPGTVMTVDTALKILMVKSANDVATALAESVGGSEQAFVARMNAEARRLGMYGSHFMNAHGLHDDRHYTTARDLAVLALTIRGEYPQYDPYFSIEALAAGSKKMDNHITLIGRFDGADGMKTGYTCPAGFNVVATAQRGGRRLMAVVFGEMSTAHRAEKTADLLAKGFRSNGFMAPRLASMRPSGPMQTQATNMRSTVCSKEARAERWKNHDEDGRMIIRSPYIHEMTRSRRVVSVSLGGATGPARPQYANVPIPTPRPDYPGAVAEGG